MGDMRANEMQVGRHVGTGKYSRDDMQTEGYANIHRLTLRQRNMHSDERYGKGICRKSRNFRQKHTVAFGQTTGR
jgi:hypothetical protein